MKNSRFLLLVIIICFIFTLAGCGASKKDADSEHQSKDVHSEEVATTEEVTTANEVSTIDEGSSEDNPFVGSVWLGTKKDFMYEYRLEFASGDTVYLLEMRDGNIERAEKSTYTQNKDEIDFLSFTLIENENYDSATETISITLPGSGLLIYFRPTDEALMELKALDSMTENSTPDGSIITIDGWPEEVPVPDFGGKIATDSGAGKTRTIMFRDIDPDKVQPYLDKLVEAGFEVTEQRDILPEEVLDDNGNPKYEAYVDENGNPFYTHTFEAVNGEIVDYETFGLSRLESGYAISIGYTLQERYDKVTGQFVGKPYARLVLYRSK